MEKLIDPYTTYFSGICLPLPFDRPLLSNELTYFFSAALGDSTITI
jgi:hypothetical protein